MINFGAMQLICTPTNLADGTAIVNPTPVKLGVLQDVTLDLSVDMKTLYGGGMYPLAVAQGRGKIEFKAKTGEISGKALGSLYLGQPSAAGIKDCVLSFPAAIPSSAAYTITVAPPASGTFVADLGVFDAASGQQFKAVASAPAAGQYTVSAAGLYTFAAADQGKAVVMNYEYSAASTSAQVFNIANRPTGQTPSFSVIGRTGYDGKILTAKFYRGVSSKLSLPFKSDDFAVSDFDISCFANAADQVGWICIQGE
ncbi:hypothetical protein [Niveibacterium sp.]|uniref:hypothetical protein n=1 Tax=Niveibacterium sp. TaxID=2017444 RepID=UPI0035B2514A